MRNEIFSSLYLLKTRPTFRIRLEKKNTIFQRKSIHISTYISNMYGFYYYLNSTTESMCINCGYELFTIKICTDTFG